MSSVPFGSDPSPPGLTTPSVRTSSMRPTIIAPADLRELRDCIAGICASDFSVHDEKGSLVVPPLHPDPIVAVMETDPPGRAEHAAFLHSAIEKAVLRKGPSLIKGPLLQHHAFIPMQSGDRTLVFVSRAFYATIRDLEEFLNAKGARYGLSLRELTLWRRKIIPVGLDMITPVADHIYRLVTMTAKLSREKSLARETGLKTSAIMELFSGVDMDTSREKLYSMLCDAILFLFSGNTASVLLRSHDHYLPVVTSGSLKGQVEHLPLPADSSLLVSALRNNRDDLCNESYTLLRLGYSEDISSLHIFPLLSQEEQPCLLIVFNSSFTPDDCATIMHLCRFVSFLLRTITYQKTLASHMTSLDSLNQALDERIAFQNPDALYESIVDVSSRFLDAERASLMLPEEARHELQIEAVRGINKRVARNIRIRIGEGVAGRVYQEGKPLIVSDIEKSLATARRPNYRTGSFVSIPLKIGEETIGVLNFADKISGEIFSDDDMTFLRYFASYASIAIRGSQLCRKSEELRTLSISDSLTGIFNRRYFNDRLAEELERGTRHDYIFSLAIFDLDDFKLFNDSEGHLAGDEILKSVADISRESLRSIDIVSRFGGEEFSIILPQTDRDEALRVVERLRKNISERIPAHWKLYPRRHITVSMGLATFPADGRTAATLIRSADKALYRAKQTGKDRTVACTAFAPLPRNPGHEAKQA